jgi:hypothetical protein
MEPPPFALDQLPKDGALVFGNWVIGHTAHENGIILIQKQTRLAVYLPWASNGWVNYRSTDGTSYVLWSRGGSDPQQRDYDIDRLLAKQPHGRIANGKFTFQNWTLIVTDETLQFQCSAMGCRMTVRRDAPVFVHNDRTIGGVK